MYPIGVGTWLRRAAIAVALLGALAILLPWVRTEMTPAGGPAEFGYHNGIPSHSIEAAVVGWNGVLASAAFAGFALLSLALPEGQGRVAALGGVAAGLATLLFAGLVFAAPDPLSNFAGEVVRVRGVPATISFNVAAGPYAVFVLGLALAAISAALWRLAGDRSAPQ
jgi:hypothetical protein